MANKILTLSFHFREPKNEFDLLIKAFNKITKEGGRCVICIQSDNILQINMHQNNNSFSSIRLNAKIVDNLSKNDFLSISKLNFGSAYFCKVFFNLKDTELCITMIENENPETQSFLNQHFEILEAALNQ